MKILSYLVALCAAAGSQAKAPNSTDCRVQALVRAQDLAPSTTSHGDLRIKVSPAHCATGQIASVALRLQLVEFAEVKYLRGGAVLPQILKADNQTRPDSESDRWTRMGDEAEVLYNYSAYDEAMRDPAIWGVKAEERKAWMTETTMFGAQLDFSQPRVTPFVVVSPAVNYPPAFISFRGISTLQPIRRHADMALAYHYIAVVTFSDGRTAEIPAGHTTFRPTFLKPDPGTPLKLSATFEDVRYDLDDLPNWRTENEKQEICLPKALQSVFIAEVSLDEGSVFTTGQRLKGKVTVRATNGSTAMSRLEVSLSTTENVRWAEKLASEAGDTAFRSSSIQDMNDRSSRRVPSSEQYEALFEEEDRDGGWSISPSLYLSTEGYVTDNQPFDFAFDIPTDFVPAFPSYYGAFGARLSLRLTTTYSRDVARCLEGDRFRESFFDDLDVEGDDLAIKEEALWDSWTKVGQTRRTDFGRAIHLRASVPVVVVGDISSQPVQHYLDANVPSPVLLASPAGAVFPRPSALPVVSVEPFENTSARLMRPGASFDPAHSRRAFWSHSHLKEEVPDPAGNYYSHHPGYTGLLWKKKMVAMERGILPHANIATQENEAQQVMFT